MVSKTIITTKNNMPVSKPQKNNSLEKMLKILDLFSEQKPIWSVDDICNIFEYTRSTAYRYAKELTDAGLLFQVEKGSYSLGAKIIVWDRQLKLTDPLVLASKKLEETSNNWPDEQAWFVCRLFKDDVICIHHFGTLASQLSFSRGIPRPLFRGAPSKAILAFLPTSQHMRLFIEYPDEIKQSNLGHTWEDFKKSMQVIRRKGFALSFSEVDKDVFGIAAPIFSKDGKVQGSLNWARSIDFFLPDKIEEEVAFICEQANLLSINAYG